MDFRGTSDLSELLDEENNKDLVQKNLCCGVDWFIWIWCPQGGDCEVDGFLGCNKV
jgi:hypothetical protein